jgi:AcrR family transcriptional regulator
MRGKILCAAHCLIYKHGFKGVSMDDVAKASGVKKANLFHYYPTKEVLGLAVFDAALADLQKQVRERLEKRDGDPIKVVAAMFDEACGDMKKSECSGGCFVGNMAQELSDYNETMRQRVSDHMQEWRRQWSVFLGEYQRTGYFRGDLDPERAATGLLSLFEGAMILCKANKDVSPLEDAKQMAVRHFESYRV